MLDARAQIRDDGEMDLPSVDDEMFRRAGRGARGTPRSQRGTARPARRRARGDRGRRSRQQRMILLDDLTFLALLRRYLKATG